MTRTRWLLLIVVLAAVGVAAAAVLAPGDDSGSGSAADRGSGGSGGTAATTTTLAPVTTAPVSTGAPATTAPPTTTVVVPGACGSLGGVIEAAVDTDVPGAAAGADVTECRLAATDATWALVRLTPKAGSSFTATTVILQGGGAWNVVATGGTDAGCGKAPQQVIADLGQFCVGSGGGGQ
jgi:hypothetical protein